MKPEWPRRRSTRTPRAEEPSARELQRLREENEQLRLQLDEQAKQIEDLKRQLSRNADGTLVGMQRRLLTIAISDGEHQLPFPKGWDERQRRDAAEARGLLNGRPVSAHVPPPETVEEFIATSRAA